MNCYETANVSTMYKGSKNISIKMLKDVGMTVPKSRETSVVYIYAATQGMRDYIYMQQDRGWRQHIICTKTGDEGMQQ